MTETVVTRGGPETVSSTVSLPAPRRNFSPDASEEDRSKIAEDLRQNGRHYLNLPEHLQKDPKIAAAAASNCLAVIDAFPESLLRNRRAVEQILQEEGSLAYNEKFALTVLGQHAELADRFDAAFREDPHFWAKVVSSSYFSFSSLPEAVKREPVVCLAAIANSNGYLDQIPPNLWQDDRFAAKAVRLNGAALEKLPPQLREREDLILTAVANNKAALDCLSADFLKARPELLRQIALTNTSSREAVQQKVGKLPSEVEQAYQRMEQAYDVLGIRHKTWGKEGEAHRARFDNSREIVRNRYAVASEDTREQLEAALGKEYFSGVTRPGEDGRPVSVIVTGKDDPEGALTQLENPEIAFLSRDNIDRQMRSGMVLYYEAGDEAQLKDALRNASQSGKTPVKTLFLNAHGAEGENAGQFMFLGRYTGGKWREEEHKFFDVRDKDIIREIQQLQPENVVLASCGIGSQNGAQQSLVDKIARALPQAHVTGPLYSTLAKVNFDHQGRICSPAFPVSANTYNPMRTLRLSFDGYGEKSDGYRRLFELCERDGYAVSYAPDERSVLVSKDREQLFSVPIRRNAEEEILQKILTDRLGRVLGSHQEALAVYKQGGDSRAIRDLKDELAGALGTTSDFDVDYNAGPGFTELSLRQGERKLLYMLIASPTTSLSIDPHL